MVVNTLMPRQKGRHFADDIFNYIFVNENLWIPIKISLKFVPKGPINNIPALVQIMAWRRPGDKPLFEPMMVRLPTHICVTRPQWVKGVHCKWKNTRWVRLIQRSREIFAACWSNRGYVIVWPCCSFPISALATSGRMCCSRMLSYETYHEDEIPLEPFSLCFIDFGFCSFIS